MKLVTALLLALPLTTLAAEHGGAPAQPAKAATDAAATATTDAKKAEDAAATKAAAGAEHGGAPAEKKP